MATDAPPSLEHPLPEENKQCTTCGRRFSDDALFCPKDGSALVSSPGGRAGKDTFVGREILGHIEIKSLIGAGAMGRVYRAHQRGIDRDVAVKILHRELAANPDLVARFLREAKVASRIGHPNVVQVILAGQLEDGTMYLVMEYLDGVSLHSALLAAGGALPITRALHIALQVCDAVGEAHAAGVIHRDVKPENIMLINRNDDLDFVKVLDFGIARLGHTTNESGVETQAGLVFGTARYLSPEGARGEHVGPSSDVYAIATVLYQMLAGRTPFEHDSSVSLLVAQIHDVPPPLRSLPRAAYVPAVIEAAIMKNLAKDASARDPDGHAFGRALLEIATHAGFAADDLIVRPAVARARNKPGGGRVPSSPQLPSMEKTGAQPFVVVGPEQEERRASPAEPVAAVGGVGADAPARAVYHPSYSGKPAAVDRPKGGLAATIDDVPEPPARLPTPQPRPIDPPPPASPPSPAATIGMVPPQAPQAQPPTRLPTPQPLPATTPVPTPKDDSMLGTASNAQESVRPPAGLPHRGRAIAAMVVAGLVAVSAIGIGGYRLGYFGQQPAPTKRAEVEDLLARAQTALEARRWDAPAGDNVVELTDKLLALAPGETRTYQIRSAAADRILHDALEARAQRENVSALRLYKLAAHLSPPDKGIQEEIESLEADLANDPAHVDEVTDGGVGKYVVTSVKVGDDKDPDGVNPNELASLVALVRDGPGAGAEEPKSADPKAHFLVSGPGLDKPVSMDARAEGTTRYVATYAFKQTGAFKVFFFARPDGFPVKSELEVKVVPHKVTGAFPTTKPSNSTLKPFPPSTGTVILTPDPTVSLPLPTTSPPLPGLP